MSLRSLPFSTETTFLNPLDLWCQLGPRFFHLRDLRTEMLAQSSSWPNTLLKISPVFLHPVIGNLITASRVQHHLLIWGNFQTKVLSSSDFHPGVVWPLCPWVQPQEVSHVWVQNPFSSVQVGLPVLYIFPIGSQTGKSHELLREGPIWVPKSVVECLGNHLSECEQNKTRPGNKREEKDLLPASDHTGQHWVISKAMPSPRCRTIRFLSGKPIYSHRIAYFWAHSV